MKNSFFFGDFFCKKLVFAFFVLLSLTACDSKAPAQEPQEPPVSVPDGSNPIDKVTFSIDSKGDIDVNKVEGTSSTRCSLDPEDSNPCFEKEIEVKEVATYVFIRYKGSDCVVLGKGSKARKVCYPPK